MAKKAAEKKKRHWLSRLSFGSVSMAMAGLLALGYVSVFIDPAKAWFFTFFGLLYPLSFAATLLLLLWALLRRSRMRGLLLAALLPSLFFAGRYVQFRSPETDVQPTLKMVSYNVGRFSMDSRTPDRLVLADSVSRWLRSTDADVICLQEFYLPKDVNIDSWLKKYFPGYEAEYYVFVGKNGRFGNVTLSRRKVEGKGRTSFEKSTNLALWTDIRLDNSTVRVYNCHFESYNISLTKLVTSSSAVEETEKKMRRSIVERPKQVAEVLQGIDSAPVHCMVLGDFNDTPASYTYFRLLRGRKDSFVQAGKGWGATYRALWPLLRIDYILHPKDLQAVTCQIPHVKYSDHYPVIASYYESRRDSQ